MRKILLAFLLLFSSANAAENFPTLTGRVVDNANLLSPASEQNLTQLLAEHEKQTTNQVVVVTVPTLDGRQIEEYGYKLGRHWGIGQKGKNNGVLFIIAPNDRQTRIEVGYGLEGTLTDALNSQIIQTIVLPKFRSSDFEGGVVDGTTAIVSVLSGKQVSFPANYQPQQHDSSMPDWVIILIVMFFIFIRLRYGFTNGWGTGSYSGGSSSGGSFSGGGGSFGGGGSSGRW
jgi:uncharacterized protein